ncbi:MAG: murein transglycosylase [Micromonosporaceae bacterium]|nr:murein transglycosylase [Micromonosporaceae bacterium]
MTEPPGPPGDDDLQRPLDESVSRTGSTEPPATVPASLRPAVPASPAQTAPEPAPIRRPSLALRLFLGPARAVWAVRRRSGRAARSLARWTGRPAGRFTLPGLLIAALLGVALATGAFLVPTTGPGPAGAPGPSGTLPSGGPSGVPNPSTAPTAPAPINTPGSVPSGQGSPAQALADWAAPIQSRTDVPMIALQAYGYAELAVRSTTPTCQLTWTTLAAIGRVESNHGSSGGARLLDDGRALPPIIGLPLDGEGERAEITDTDGGALDNDLTYDRAVGPMQFIPGTWQLEAVDATGDGIADVHNIHDAALAAANYLCRSGRDLTTPGGWWAAVLSYNNLQSYAEDVFAAANDYGQASRGGAA